MGGGWAAEQSIGEAKTTRFVTRTSTKHTGRPVDLLFGL